MASRKLLPFAIPYSMQPWYPAPSLNSDSQRYNIGVGYSGSFVRGVSQTYSSNFGANLLNILGNS